MNLTALAKTVISKGAPLIGAVLGTPAGAVIGQIVASAFGSTSDLNNPDDIINAINLDPDAKVKLLQIESDQKIELQKLLLQNQQMENQNVIDTLKANIQNTEDAREYNNKHSSSLYFSMVISFLVTVSFYACIYWVAAYPQDSSDHDVLYMLFGVAGTSFGAVVNYWLGSSAEKGYKPK